MSLPKCGRCECEFNLAVNGGCISTLGPICPDCIECTPSEIIAAQRARASRDAALSAATRAGMQQAVYGLGQDRALAAEVVMARAGAAALSTGFESMQIVTEQGVITTTTDWTAPYQNRDAITKLVKERDGAEKRANQLSDRCGSLETELRDVKAENSDLRRRIERLERKGGR